MKNFQTVKRNCTFELLVTLLTIREVKGSILAISVDLFIFSFVTVHPYF
jgi:hypothetical protein